MSKEDYSKHDPSLASDPLVSFSFQVRFADGGDIVPCSGVDGLTKEVEMIEYRDAENPKLPKFRQGRPKAPRITLKKAFIGGKTNPFFEWLANADNGEIEARNVEVIVGASGSYVTSAKYEEFADKAKTKSVWYLTGCRPVKWSVGSLDSSSNALVIENIELVAESISMTKK